MSSSYFWWMAIVVVCVTVILILLHHAGLSLFRNKKIYKTTLYLALSVEITFIVLALFGEPLLNKLYAYRENVFKQFAQECKKEDAPFWCN
ncbi:MAG: hypothetical protein O6852_05990 [Gammaproteobacteria bacterium]|nr:hypothetical protein [Gammaproteobacteria bacterium]